MTTTTTITTTAPLSSFVVLVTGCSDGGIGAALVRALATARSCPARPGARIEVFATARRVAAMASLEGVPNVHLLPLDVTSADSIAAAVAAVRARAGRLDLLVNNAGSGCVGAVLDVSAAAVRALLETNVVAPVELARACVPLMLESTSTAGAAGAATADGIRGRIVNMGSIVGDVSTPWGGVYCMSKAAVHSLSDALRMELRPLGVSVAVIRPGAIVSNIGRYNVANLNFDPAASLFAPYERFIRARAVSSQSARSTPTDEFAGKAVAMMLARGPMPAYWTYGHLAALFAFLRWMPWWVRDFVFSRFYGLAGTPTKKVLAAGGGSGKKDA